MALKNGSRARIKAPVVEGEIVKVKFDEETGEKRLLLAWKDADGATQERWFSEGELEEVAA